MAEDEVDDPAAADVRAVADRATWYKAVHDGFKGANVDGCAWAYTNTMYFRDPGTDAWIGQLLTAIGL